MKNTSYSLALNFAFTRLFPMAMTALLLMPLAKAEAEGKTVRMGKAGEPIVVTSMKGLESGDTIQIPKGTYPGGTFTHLKGITIVPDEGGVTFNGPISIGDDNGVVFDGTVLSGVTYGFTFSNFSQGFAAFQPTQEAIGNMQNCAIKGVQVLDTGGSVLDGNAGSIIYDGTPETCLYYNMTLDTIKETGRSIVYSGTWAANSTYKNVNIGMTMKNIICESNGTGSPTKVLSYSLYNMVADNWQIIGPTQKAGDTGVFSIYGNCTLKNIYRHGGWGWLLRIFNCSLNKSSTTWVYNCIDVDTVTYGTVDTRIDVADINANPDAKIPIVGNDTKIINVTSGNKGNVTGFTSSLAIVYSTSDRATPEPHMYEADIINCVAFNNKALNHSSLFLDGDITAKKNIVQKNNIDIVGPIPDGYFVDQVKFYPAKDSPLIGKGMVVPEVTKDIYGNPRGDTNDVGAVQYKEGVTPEPEPPSDAATNSAPDASTPTDAK